jgi:hypothetical protein
VLLAAGAVAENIAGMAFPQFRVVSWILPAAGGGFLLAYGLLMWGWAARMERRRSPRVEFMGPTGPWWK